MTKKLILMRHAKSDWQADYSQDFERPLNRRGHKDATRMGEWLLANELPVDVIICSPALRARQTAEQLADKIGYLKNNIINVDSLYEAGLNTALYVAQEAVASNSLPLIIAHNPTMDSLVEMLSEQRPPLSATGKLMTTAAMAVFSFNDEIEVHGCRLEHLIRPKEL